MWSCNLDADQSESVVISTNSNLNADHDAYAYVTGYIIRRFISCDTCKAALTKSSIRTPFINIKCYDGCVLFDPVDDVTNDVDLLKNRAFAFLEQVAHIDKVSAHLQKHTDIQDLFDLKFIHSSCQSAVKSILLKSFCNFFIKVYCLRRTQSLTNHKQQTINKYKKLIN
jgi:hypothetical protein